MWHAFGDESSFPSGVVTYAIVGVQATAQTSAEAEFRKLKLAFGGQEHSRIHCRELLAFHSRQKSDWKHLTQERALELLTEAARLAERLGLRRNVGIVDAMKAPSTIAGVGSATEALKLTDKHYCTFAFVAVASSIFQQVRPDQVRLWIDPDKTKIDWWGKRRQAGLTRELTLMDFGMEKVRPETDPLSDRSLLDLADLVAYTTGKVRSESDQTERSPFHRILAILAPGTAEFDLWTDGQ